MTDKRQVVVVTSFNKKLWDSYAKETVGRWPEFLGPDIEVHAYVDGPVPDDVPPSFKVWSLESFRVETDDPEETEHYVGYKDYHRKFGHVESPAPGYRWEHLRFWPKVYSMYRSAKLLMFREPPVLMVWMDADVKLTGPVTTEWFNERLPEGYMAGLMLRNRPPLDYLEGGVMLFADYAARGLFEKMVNLYMTGTLFQFREWHDAFLLQQVLNIEYGSDLDYEGIIDLTKGNLSTKDQLLDPMAHSVLSDRMIHLKGSRKDAANKDNKNVQDGNSERE